MCGVIREKEKVSVVLKKEYVRKLYLFMLF